MSCMCFSCTHACSHVLYTCALTYMWCAVLYMQAGKRMYAGIHVMNACTLKQTDGPHLHWSNSLVYASKYAKPKGICMHIFML